MRLATFAVLCLLPAMAGSAVAKQSANEETIRIGFMVSDNPDNDPLSREAIDAAQLAVDEVNESGGISGRRAELVIRTSDGDWGASSIKSIELIYDEDVHAIVGSLEGRDAHLVEMAIAKAHIVYLETRATDPTLSEANLPWFFRILPSDKQQAQKLASEIFENRQLNNILILYSDAYDHEMAANTFLRYTRNNGFPVPEMVTFDRRSPDYEKLIQSVKNLDVDSILIYADPGFIKRMNNEMSQSGIQLPLFTSLSILRDRELLSDFNQVQKLTFVCPDNWQTTNNNSFRDKFSNKYGYQPGVMGAYAYDGINVLTHALSHAIHSNEELTGSVANTDYTDGITGHIQFLETGDIHDNTRICNVE